MTRVVRWLGLTVVLAAAAVLSFDGLRELALSVSIPVDLAWLLPVVVDAGAAVSCACWLSREVPEDAQLFARALTWSLLGGTVAGNAAQLGMRAEGVTPAWWVAVIVGAVAPAVLGAVVHLAVLVGRGVAQEGVEPSPLTGSALEADASAGSATEPQPVIVAAGTDSSPATSATAPALHLLPTAADLIAAGAGRKRLARELDISEYEARQLIERARA